MNDKNVHRSQDGLRREASDGRRRPPPDKSESRRRDERSRNQHRQNQRREERYRSDSDSDRSRSRSRSRRPDKSQAARKKQAPRSPSRKRDGAPRRGRSSSLSASPRERDRSRKQSPPAWKRDKPSPAQPGRPRADSHESEDSVARLVTKLQKRGVAQQLQNPTPHEPQTRKPAETLRANSGQPPGASSKLQTFVDTQNFPVRQAPRPDQSAAARRPAHRQHADDEALQAGGQLISQKRIGKFDIVELEIKPRSHHLAGTRQAPRRDAHDPGSCHLRDRIVKKARATEPREESERPPADSIIKRIKKRPQE